MIHLENIAKIWNCKYLCKLQKNQIDMLKGAMNTWVPDALGYKKHHSFLLFNASSPHGRPVVKRNLFAKAIHKLMSSVTFYWDKSKENKDMWVFNMIKLMAAQL